MRYGDDVLAIEGLGFAVYDGLRWRQDFFNAHVRPLAHQTVELIRLEGKFVEPLPDEEAAVAAAEEAFGRYRELRKKGKARTPEEEIELMQLGRIVDLGAECAKSIADRRAKRIRYAKTSASSGKMDNMLAEAKVYRSRPVTILDSDPLALNVENGTLRLVRGGPLGKPIWIVRRDAHAKGDYISKLAPVIHDEAAGAPLFLGFLEQILPDDATRAFLQRWLGYCITALTVEQVFVFLYGTGRNGKSTLIDLVCRILGDYTATVPFETLAGDDRRKGGDATPDLVRLPGARLVRASEPEQGMKFRESMVKSLTSGEPILIRRMREEFIEVYPNFKLNVSGNHRPDIRGDDEGIWRRVLLVPFDVQIPKTEIDKGLPDKLFSERAGILNWLVAGALSYLEQGLAIPDSVRAATEDYREESDTYGAFLAAACAVTGDDKDSVSPGALYGAFRRFCERQGRYCVSVSAFNKKFPEKAGTHGFRKAKSMGLSVYRGLTIKPDYQDDPSDIPPAGDRDYDR